MWAIAGIGGVVATIIVITAIAEERVLRRDPVFRAAEQAKGKFRPLLAASTFILWLWSGYLLLGPILRGTKDPDFTRLPAVLETVALLLAFLFVMLIFGFVAAPLVLFVGVMSRRAASIAIAVSIVLTAAPLVVFLAGVLLPLGAAGLTSPRYFVELVQERVTMLTLVVMTTLIAVLLFISVVKGSRWRQPNSAQQLSRPDAGPAAELP